MTIMRIAEKEGREFFNEARKALPKAVEKERERARKVCGYKCSLRVK